VVDTLTSDLTKHRQRVLIPPAIVSRHLHSRPRNLHRWKIKLLPDEDTEAASALDEVMRRMQGLADTSDLTI